MCFFSGNRLTLTISNELLSLYIYYTSFFYSPHFLSLCDIGVCVHVEKKKVCLCRAEKRMTKDNKNNNQRDANEYFTWNSIQKGSSAENKSIPLLALNILGSLEIFVMQPFCYHPHFLSMPTVFAPFLVWHLHFFSLSCPFALFYSVSCLTLSFSLSLSVSLLFSLLVSLLITNSFENVCAHNKLSLSNKVFITS